MEAYEAGRKALAMGLIPAHDMTPEAATTKLKWLLGVAKAQIKEGKLKPKHLHDFIRLGFQHDRAGEITLERNSPLPVPFKRRAA